MQQTPNTWQLPCVLAFPILESGVEKSCSEQLVTTGESWYWEVPEKNM